MLALSHREVTKMASTKKSAAATACAPSKAQLLRFVKIRNESGFQSNLQFQFDASECGFEVRDLDGPYRYEPGGWRWFTPHGELIEHPGGRMELKEAANG
jgi:hypothetical protein